MSTINVTIHRSPIRWPIRRPQRWFWIATNAGNHKPMGRASEMYTNEADAYRAAELLFGNYVDVVLVRPGKANRILRRPL